MLDFIKKLHRKSEITAKENAEVIHVESFEDSIKEVKNLLEKNQNPEAKKTDKSITNSVSDEKPKPKEKFPQQTNLTEKLDAIADVAASLSSEYELEYEKITKDLQLAKNFIVSRGQTELPARISYEVDYNFLKEPNSEKIDDGILSRSNLGSLVVSTSADILQNLSIIEDDLKDSTSTMMRIRNSDKELP